MNPTDEIPGGGSPHRYETDVHGGECLSARPDMLFAYSSNDDGEMQIVCELLRQHGVAAELLEIVEPAEWEGLQGVFVPEGTDLEELKPVIAEFRNVRDQVKNEERAQQRGYVFLFWLLLAGLAGLISVAVESARGEGSPESFFLAFSVVAGFGVLWWLVRSVAQR